MSSIFSGGFNKLLRNIAASTTDTEFEQRLTKATFSLDNKEPKEKHVIYMLECFNGEHRNQIKMEGALKLLFERMITCLDNWTINVKVLLIMHRSLQNIKVNRKIYAEMKKKEHLIHSYQNKKAETNFTVRMHCEISRQYANYIKAYLQVSNKTDIMAKSMTKLSEEVALLRTGDILKNYEYFEALVTQIFGLFQHANFCRQTRLFSNMIFLLFKDLIKMYKVYYVHMMEILERFEKLSAPDAQKTFIMYQNFVNLTASIRTKASKLLYMFNFPMQLPDFYNPEKDLVEAFKMVSDRAKANNEGNSAAMCQLAQKVRQGMNRSQFQTRAPDKNNDDADKAYKFDVTIADPNQKSASEQNPNQSKSGSLSARGGNTNDNKFEENKQAPLDLLNFINNSANTSNGNSNTGQQQSDNSQQDDFAKFLSAQGSGANNATSSGNNGSKTARVMSRQNDDLTSAAPKDQLANDLMDIFGPKNEATSFDAVFGAAASQPMNALQQPQQFQTQQQPVQQQQPAFQPNPFMMTNQNQQQQQQQNGDPFAMYQQQQGANPFQTQQPMMNQNNMNDNNMNNNMNGQQQQQQQQPGQQAFNMQQQSQNIQQQQQINIQQQSNQPVMASFNFN